MEKIWTVDSPCKRVCLHQDQPTEHIDSVADYAAGELD